MREWLIRYIEHAFWGVELTDGTTLYEAAFLADYGFDSRELALAENAERTDWRRVPVDHLFARTDAIFFMNSAGKRFYSPAILRAVLMEGTRNGLMYDAFILIYQDSFTHHKKLTSHLLGCTMHRKEPLLYGS